MDHDHVPLERRLDALEGEVRSLRSRLDLLMGALAVLMVAGQIALGVWLTRVIH